MFTRAEKGYLALTLFFLAAGSGIKAYRHSLVKLGPFPAAVPAQHPGNDSASGPVDSAVSASAHPDSGSPGSGALPEVAADGTRFSGGDSLSPPSADPRSGSAEPPTGRAHAASNGNRAAGTKADFTGKVDVNRADASALTRVKGIGEKTAQAILEYRKAHGPFRDLRELLQVKGIGQKKLEKLSPFLIL
jgi:competence protein ComEA